MSNVEVQLRGHKVFNSGIMDYGNSMTITFVETEDNMILKLIKAWREIMWLQEQVNSSQRKNQKLLC